VGQRPWAGHQYTEWVQQLNPQQHKQHTGLPLLLMVLLHSLTLKLALSLVSLLPLLLLLLLCWPALGCCWHLGAATAAATCLPLAAAAAPELAVHPASAAAVRPVVLSVAAAVICAEPAAALAPAASQVSGQGCTHLWGTAAAPNGPVLLLLLLPLLLDAGRVLGMQGCSWACL
jgi:hypothetical protein